MAAALDEYELAAVNSVSTMAVEEAADTETDTTTNDPHASIEDKLKAALRRQGVVVAPTAAAPYGTEEEELVCGVCLDAPAPGQLATLWCCKNVLCLKDAQLIGACPFCREEPLVWELALPSEVSPYASA